MRSIVIVLSAILVGLLASCRHPANVTTDRIEPVPGGLDSAGVAKWVDARRAACSGRFGVLVDEGGATRGTGGFRNIVVGVSCSPR